MKVIKNTNFNFPNQTGFYKGKVRDVYSFENLLVMVASDRISAFDVVLPKAIPFKGQVLNQIAEHFLNATRDVVPNWLVASPDPNVSVGLKCETYPVEMVVRGYLAGHAWRTYKSGLRTLCGVTLPEGLKENDKLPTPIITPTTKAHEGHDEDISREEILAKGLVSEEEYSQLEKYTLALFAKGTAMAAEQKLILVDTKYEFGKKDNQITLIDEIHTPDSSRYFYAEGYEERQKNNEAQKQLSKEFVREWLIANGFQGKDGQVIPEMTDEWVNQVSERYIELFEQVTGKKFIKDNSEDVLVRVEENVNNYLKSL
ncbi:MULTISPECIES: phosphoribosylaminoimidazolesuccinocarboxamide synthase [unclassified Arcicella]|uniref:phosphoribosylaminoimidazolesuccinocarboxamide synthase n=1 Tax=unclassified Arcicella TaxID=2644986 RepID=UPI00286306F0|nr:MULTISPECIES: phosphoribosylaminoimidazolesuccinocarboxamide synthase [unclassified Arcicella]MDR6562578.1 phosphoribosylaminoimidazole-succinocarboxamide synthase [Arcicella sp. BE51]MDR6812665.1 phosphoribosylaminoimidazole-succinocarboxamide synthase [Arcicella sp. BE140]MDR6823977.1 phosphoribosylaminoimidazole-succinocarboxamide synthase [Arcicella sp. BE139]